jgi:uroporphyrinogen III methyltransferase/synthase
MAVGQLRSNMERLIAGGLAATAPVALIQWGTRADQETVVGTAATIAELAEAGQVRPPAIAVVGEVVQLREQLNWFERKPLFGRRIVITRPRAQAAEFAERLEAHGAEVIPFPTIEMALPPSLAAVDDAMRRAAEFDWVVFTSANGVRVFFDRLQALGGDVRDWHCARFAAIGPQTARALQQYYVRVDIVPEEFRAEAVVEALVQAGVAGKRVLLPRAAGARDVLPVQLRQHGALIEEVATYTTALPSDTAGELRGLLLSGGADLVTFTSSSTVDNFVTVFEGEVERVLAHAAVGCIGPITADTARSYGLRVDVQPTSYTIPAFVEAIVRYYSGQPRKSRRVE